MIEIVRVLMWYENTPISSPDKRLLRPPLSPPTFLDKPSGIAERGGEIRENEKAPKILYPRGFSFKKDGGFLLSRIALQYHRRRWA